MNHSADAVFGALSRVLGEAAQLADAMPDVFLFTVRLAVSIEEFAQAADEQRDAAAADANNNRDGRDDAGAGAAPRLASEAREQLLSYLGSHAAARVRAWLSTARRDDIAMQVDMHVHLALIAAVQIGAARVARTARKRALAGGGGGGARRVSGGRAARHASPASLAGAYDALIEAFSVSSAFVLSWVTNNSATGKIARYPHVLAAVFAGIQKNAADVARWSMHPAHAAARNRVLTRMKAVVIGRAALDAPLVTHHSSSLGAGGDGGDGGAGGDEWQAHSMHVTMCCTVLSSPTPALANSDVYEAIAFPGASYISISFDDDTKLSDDDWVKFYKVHHLVIGLSG